MGKQLHGNGRGFQRGTRERSYSLPSIYGLQYGVQGNSRPAPLVSSRQSELGELKELLKRQQEQLNQLTQTVPSLQTHSPRNGPLICLRCQQPGHFARDCDGDRVPPRALANSVTGQLPSLPASLSSRN